MCVLYSIHCKRELDTDGRRRTDNDFGVTRHQRHQRLKFFFIPSHFSLDLSNSRFPRPFPTLFTPPAALFALPAAPSTPSLALFFSALLFGGLRESHEGRVDLPNTSADGFRILLHYVYSGRINLVDLKEDQLLEQLGLANRYGFSDYENAIVHYLKAIIETRNVCDVYNVANLYSLTFLETVCLNYLDRNASEILTSESFLNLSANSVVAIVSRDSFCAPEEEIFRAVRAWAEANPEEDHGRPIACIRLNIMQIPELLNVVRPSSLVSSDAILDAIDSRHRSSDMELSYRGYLIPDENVAHPRHGAQVQPLGWS